MSFGTVTSELAEWLAEHADPAYKPKKASVARKTPLRKFNKNDVYWDMREYEYSFGFDYRTIKEPVSLDVFLERKHDPKYRAWQLPKRRATVPTLSVKARAAESGRIARYVASRAA